MSDRADELLAMKTFVKLVRAAETVSGRVHRHLAGTRLTVSQFGIMEALYHLGPLNQKQLALKILKSSGNITLVIDNLERLGLVSRRREIKDRRCITVDLTETGRELIAGIFPRHAAGIAAEMSLLTPGEQEELGRICRKLGLKNKEGKRENRDLQ